MKTIKEQIEIMQHFENGGEVKRVHLVGDHSDLKIFSKDKHSHICFNWNDYDYEIHKEVKPLFPTKEQGAKYIVDIDGRIRHVNDFFNCGDYSEYFAKQGRTFYTQEDAELFVRREQAKTHCLEAINRVNGGDNGFKADNHNHHIDYKPQKNAIGVDSTATYLSLEPNEYIRTEEAAKELINDPEFVENWKIWKGVE